LSCWGGAQDETSDDGDEGRTETQRNVFEGGWWGFVEAGDLGVDGEIQHERGEERREVVKWRRRLRWWSVTRGECAKREGCESRQDREWWAIGE
jgi:hypothetical protein